MSQKTKREWAEWKKKKIFVVAYVSDMAISAEHVRERKEKKVIFTANKKSVKLLKLCDIYWVKHGKIWENTYCHKSGSLEIRKCLRIIEWDDTVSENHHNKETSTFEVFKMIFVLLHENGLNKTFLL